MSSCDWGTEGGRDGCFTRAYLRIGSIEHLHLIFEIHPLDFGDQVLFHAGWQIRKPVVVLAPEGLEEGTDTRCSRLGGRRREVRIVNDVGVLVHRKQPEEVRAVMDRCGTIDLSTEEKGSPTLRIQQGS